MKSVVAALPNVILLEQQIPQNLLQMFYFFVLTRALQNSITSNIMQQNSVVFMESWGVLYVSKYYIMFHAFLYLLTCYMLPVELQL